tara:strand:+ start:244 stop:543 length:300 start_codon:yes stop_codon:yes gene_type:complete
MTDVIGKPIDWTGMYSVQDIDGYPMIPTNDNYMSQDAKYIGLSALHEASADIEFMYSESPERLCNCLKPINMYEYNEYIWCKFITDEVRADILYVIGEF